MIDIFINFIAQTSAKLPTPQPLYGVQATQNDWEIIAGWVLGFLIVIVIPIVLIVYFMRRKK